MYYASTLGPAKIKPIEIAKYTAKTVTTASGKMRAKLSTIAGYFDTPGQAYKFLSDHSEQKIIDANRAMKAAQEYAEQVAKLAPNAR